MVDPGTIATEAIAVASPYLVDFGKEAAKSAADGAGKVIWEWIKGKLMSPAGKEAVDDLEKGPGEADNRKAAEAALAKFLKADPDAISELAKLLEKTGVASVAQTANVTGNDNIVGQASGSGISLSINKGSS